MEYDKSRFPTAISEWEQIARKEFDIEVEASEVIDMHREVAPDSSVEQVYMEMLLARLCYAINKKTGDSKAFFHLDDRDTQLIFDGETVDTYDQFKKLI